MSSVARTKGAVTPTKSLEIDTRHVAKSSAITRIKPGREFASLSEARVIKESGRYWIGAQGREIEPREVKPVDGGASYLGRTFEGVPSIPGDFTANKDNTFTKINAYKDANWEDRVYVSEWAASNSGMHEILELSVGSFASVIRRLGLYAGRSSTSSARVVSVLGPETTGQIAPIPKEIVRAARREYLSQIERNPLIATDAFPAYLALLEAAERQ